MTVDEYLVEPGFFRTMGIQLLRGRDLTQKEADGDKPTAVVINETLARRLWPGEDPVGKRLTMRDDKTMSQVVGVVKDGKYHTLGEAPASRGFSRTASTRAHAGDAHRRRLADAIGRDSARGSDCRSADGGHRRADH